jgi:hypothetical protein
MKKEGVLADPSPLGIMSDELIAEGERLEGLPEEARIEKSKELVKKM